MYHAFSTPPSQREAQRVDFGDWKTRDDKIPDLGTGLQQHEILMGITSFFQLLRNSESEMQRRVNEMDKVGLFTYFPHPRANVGCSVWRTLLCRTAND